MRAFFFHYGVARLALHKSTNLFVLVSKRGQARAADIFQNTARARSGLGPHRQDITSGLIEHAAGRGPDQQRKAVFSMTADDD